MTLKLPIHRTENCAHTADMVIEIAGMKRAVCESCGRVSLDYVEDHFRKRLAQSGADTKFGSIDSLDG